MLPFATLTVRGRSILVLAALCLWSSVAEVRAAAPKTSPSDGNTKTKTIPTAAAIPREVPPLAARTTPDVDPSTVRDNDLLDQERERRTVMAERLSRHVLQTIEASRKLGMQDPGAALTELKRSLTTVISANSLLTPMCAKSCAPGLWRASIRFTRPAKKPSRIASAASRRIQPSRRDTWRPTNWCSATNRSSS